MEKFVKPIPPVDTWRRAIRGSILDSTTKLVMHELGFWFERYECKSDVYPSQALVAERTSLKRETVNRSIKKAEKLGFLKIVGKGKKGFSNRYQMDLPLAGPTTWKQIN